jgi:hypothetical protein
MFASLSDKCANASAKKFRQEIADPIERRLNEDLKQHHPDDGERDHAL